MSKTEGNWSEIDGSRALMSELGTTRIMWVSFLVGLRVFSRSRFVLVVDLDRLNKKNFYCRIFIEVDFHPKMDIIQNPILHFFLLRRTFY